MDKQITRLTLDVGLRDSYKVVFAKMGDTERRVIAEIKDNGEEYSLTGVNTVEVRCRKADGKQVTKNATKENNTVVIDISGQMTTCKGTAIVDVVLYGTSGGVLSTAKFYLNVDDGAVSEDEIKSSNEYENPTIGTKIGKDDFSYVMPWAGIVSKCCDLDTGETVAYIGEPGYDPTKYMVLTEYPGYYLKRWRDDTYEYVQISAGAFDGAVYIEPWEWGRYPSSLMGNKHVSMSGKHPDSRITRATVRSRSKATGEGYYSMDSTSYWAYSMLVLVKYARR